MILVKCPFGISAEGRHSLCQSCCRFRPECIFEGLEDHVLLHQGFSRSEKASSQLTVRWIEKRISDLAFCRATLRRSSSFCDRPAKRSLRFTNSGIEVGVEVLASLEDPCSSQHYIHPTKTIIFKKSGRETFVTGEASQGSFGMASSWALAR